MGLRSWECLCFPRTVDPAWGEAVAYLELLPGDAASIANALIADRVALFDYALKSQVHAAKRLTAAWAGSKQE